MGKPIHYRKRFDPDVIVGQTDDCGDMKPGPIVGRLMSGIRQFIPQAHRHRILTLVHIDENGLAMGWLYPGGADGRRRDDAG